jgi:alkanesulfonate monooxygenase SsuD/methylene tetrahydromethanopterin reductase-like flavin-dependent oxidoreductase (luciferase family)
MKFGLWDHVDVSGRPLAKLYDERLEFIAAGDAAGYHCYQVAEHHATPLNLVPIPGVFLGAAARATTRIRLGPLCYLLPLYSPLRLIEEICILDQLSHGRLEIGVGRGVSPFEMNFHNVDFETAREVFQEVLEVVINGLTHDRLDHQGKRFSYKNVPMELKPLQQPHPPIWYPSSNEGGAAWAGERGYHYVTLGPIESARKNVAAYRAALAKRGAPDVASPDFPGGTAIGINRHIVIADTDAEALRIAKPAHERYYDSLTKLWRENVQGPVVAASSKKDVEEEMQAGSTIVGSPDTVRAEIERQIKAIGLNYMLCGFIFGGMTLADAMRSQSLFATEIMPKLSHL